MEVSSLWEELFQTLLLNSVRMVWKSWPLSGHLDWDKTGLKNYLTDLTLSFYQWGIRYIGIIITDTIPSPFKNFLWTEQGPWEHYLFYPQFWLPNCYKVGGNMFISTDEETGSSSFLTTTHSRWVADLEWHSRFTEDSGLNEVFE